MLRYHDHWIKLTAHVSASGRGMQKPDTSPRSPFDERMASREGPMQWDIGTSQNFANTLPELHLFFPLSPKSLSSCARNGTVPCSPEQAGSRTNPAPWPACRGSGTSRGRRTMWWSPWNGAGGDMRHALRFVCRYSACNSGGLHFSFRKRTDRLYLPVESIIYAIAVSSFEAESVRLKALFTGPILIIVHVKNGIIKACTQCIACLLLLTSNATQHNAMEMSRHYKYLQFSEQLGWIHIA